MTVNVLRETFESDVMKSTWKNPIINSKENKTWTKKGSINIAPNCEVFFYIVILTKTLNADLTKRVCYPCPGRKEEAVFVFAWTGVKARESVREC